MKMTLMLTFTSNTCIVADMLLLQVLERSQGEKKCTSTMSLNCSFFSCTKFVINILKKYSLVLLKIN